MTPLPPENIGDFLNSPIKGCKNFFWKEALSLRELDTHCIPTLNQEIQIMELAVKLERIRHIIGFPMFITSWLRPGWYNEMIGGAKGSWHKTGGGADFKCMGVSADRIREQLRPKLHELGIRVENLPGSSWVHVDNKKVVTGERFFKP